MLSLPGLALAYATNSGSVLARTEGWTTITKDVRDNAATGMIAADDGAIEDVEGSEQRGGSVTRVVVRSLFRRARSKLQERLRAFQGLNLGLFVDAQHDGVVGRVHIEPDNVPNFRGELRIVAELERLHPIRLQLVLRPDPLDCRGADFLESKGSGWSGVVDSDRPVRRSEHALEVYRSNRVGIVRSILRLAP